MQHEQGKTTDPEAKISHNDYERRNTQSRILEIQIEQEKLEFQTTERNL